MKTIKNPIKALENTINKIEKLLTQKYLYVTAKQLRDKSVVILSVFSNLKLAKKQSKKIKGYVIEIENCINK